MKRKVLVGICRSSWRQCGLSGIVQRLRLSRGCADCGHALEPFGEEYEDLLP